VQQAMAVKMEEQEQDEELMPLEIEEVMSSYEYT
jgi:hypothetical protein